MRIRCPYCGERSLSEFAYLGDANADRPAQGAKDLQVRFLEAVYLRDNPLGTHHELWYHASGCRSWLRVIRDTCTHQIFTVEFAQAEY
jgi:heterotetrameric sarcosine oxidase delta subunit